jgi:hypothetical protein
LKNEIWKNRSLGAFRQSIVMAASFLVCLRAHRRRQGARIGIGCIWRSEESWKSEKLGQNYLNVEVNLWSTVFPDGALLPM